MPERRSLRDRLGGGSLDPMDRLVIGVVAVLVVGLTAYAAVTVQGRTRVATEVRPVAAASIQPSPTEQSAPVVDVIAASAGDARTIATGVEGAVNVRTRSLSGDGFTAANRGYPSVAAGVDEDASVVVVVPSASDRASGLFDLQARVSTTVAVILKRAPGAEVVLVGPVVSSARGESLPAMRASLKSLAKTLDVAYVDPTDRGWVGTRVDSNGAVTAAGLRSVADGIGARVEALL